MLEQTGFDSVFSPGGNKHIGGCRESGYVIYDAAKITPAYVVVLPADYYGKRARE